jgi:hypothetical protein
MARASYLIRREGRWWFQARFDPYRNPGDPVRHVRFALRTSDYVVAVGRMLRVMSIVTEFKLQPEHRAAAVELLDRMVKALAVSGP